MKKASWIVLAVLGAAVTLISLVSAKRAYDIADDYEIGGVAVSAIASAHEGLGPALRGIRGTSAAYGLAFGILFLAIVLGPYKRGEVWAWYALLVAGLAQFLIVALRIPILGTELGFSATAIQTGLLVLGLALDAGRLKSVR